ncbi:MAG: FHA domain-containing protein, partial [Deltaproteobacteria bacterium]|nr:FHA domain-containing protein [Deltaproteobacteria bacterium]
MGEGIFLIGRNPENDIPLNDTFISRQHAELSVSNGIAVIEDLGSRNKTFVNDKAVKRAILKNRDKIQIGDYNLEFLSDTFVEKAPDIKTSITTVFNADDNPLFTRESDCSDRSELLLAHQKLIALYKIGNIINTTLKTDELLGRILDSIFEVMNADRVSILVWDDELNDFKISIARSRDKRYLASEIQFSRTIFEEAFNNNKAVLTL